MIVDFLNISIHLLTLFSWSKSYFQIVLPFFKDIPLFADKDSCSGDSGGPAVMKIGIDSPWYQVGITSFGTSRCGVGDPGVYTKVTAYLPWIEKKLEP